MRLIRLHASMLWCACIVLPVQAGSIKDAFALASAFDQPLQQAQQLKAERAQLNAQSLTPEPLALTISGARPLDQAGTPAEGAREFEAELGIPLWQWGQQQRRLAELKQVAQLDFTELQRQRWLLAGELREAVWAARLAQHEQFAAEQLRNALQTQVDDLARQLKAGEVAPLEFNLAQQALIAAKMQLETSQQQAEHSVLQFQALVGSPMPLPTEPEQIDERVNSPHPQQAALLAQAELARAQLAQAQYDTRDTPELALSITRERGSVDEGYSHAGKIALRLPFGTDGRTQARIASANADLISAQTSAQRSAQQLAAQQTAARQAYELAQRSVVLQQSRFELAQQSWEWQQRSYRAGQIGFAAYLAAQRDYLDQQLALKRNELEQGRAASRYLQTLGVLP